LADRRVVWCCFSRKQGHDRHHHARRAVPTLQRSCLDKRGLHRVQTFLGSQPLHRGYSSAVERLDVQGAGPRGNLIDEYCARAALRLTAAVLRSGQTQIVPEHLEQGSA